MTEPSVTAAGPEAMSESSGVRRTTGWVVPILAMAALAAFTLVFVLSAAIGGGTWDEVIHREGAELQIAVGGGWLAGEATTFRSIRHDLAFYGMVPIGLVAGFDAAWQAMTGGALSARAYGIALHALTFVLYGISGLVVFSGLRREAQYPLTPWLGAAFLLLYPLWLGYGLMDYKDVPTAVALLLLVYCSARALADGDGLVRWTTFAALATIALGGTKLAALAFGVVPWVALAIAAFRRRRWALPVVAGIATLAGLVLVTPASWPEPVAFFRSAIELMSRHPWPGCIITAGTCIGPSHDDWSAGQYLFDWAIVQMPLVVILGILPAIVFALWRGGIGRIAAATLLFSLGAIVVRNASLYDGLRHVVFAIPLVVIVLFVALDALLASLRRIAGIAVLALIGMELATFAIDDVRMFPYNYVYFNLAARGGIDPSAYETEYWGFSLHEAVAKARSGGRELRHLAGYPAHLVAASLADRPGIGSVDDLRNGGHTGRYVLVSLTRRDKRPPAACKTIAKVSRSLLGGPRLLLSWAARCEMD